MYVHVNSMQECSYTSYNTTNCRWSHGHRLIGWLVFCNVQMGEWGEFIGVHDEEHAVEWRRKQTVCVPGNG